MFFWLYCAGQKVTEIKKLSMPAWGRNSQSFKAALFLLPSSVRYFSFRRLRVKTTRFCTTRQETSLDRLNMASRESRVLLCPLDPWAVPTLSWRLWDLNQTIWVHRRVQQDTPKRVRGQLPTFGKRRDVGPDALVQKSFTGRKEGVRIQVDQFSVVLLSPSASRRTNGDNSYTKMII